MRSGSGLSLRSQPAQELAEYRCASRSPVTPKSMTHRDADESGSRIHILAVRDTGRATSAYRGIVVNPLERLVRRRARSPCPNGLPTLERNRSVVRKRSGCPELGLGLKKRRDLDELELRLRRSHRRAHRTSCSPDRGELEIRTGCRPLTGSGTLDRLSKPCADHLIEADFASVALSDRVCRDQSERAAV